MQAEFFDYPIRLGRDLRRRSPFPQRLLEDIFRQIFHKMQLSFHHAQTQSTIVSRTNVGSVRERALHALQATAPDRVEQIFVVFFLTFPIPAHVCPLQKEPNTRF